MKMFQESRVEETFYSS